MTQTYECLVTSDGIYEARHVTEAVDFSGTYVDPRTPYYDDGERWLPLGYSESEESRWQSGFANEQELRDARSACRYVARMSEYAINAHENRINYIVGWGHTYSVDAKPGFEPSEELQAIVTEWLVEWIELNRWHERQQEIVRRMDRDGEVFLRKFKTDDGLVVRFVEPGSIFTPTEKANDRDSSFGIVNDPEDVETVLGYYVGGQIVDSREIQHRKRNVDCNVKRGCPLLWPSFKKLLALPKLEGNMAHGAMLQTSVAYERIVTGGGSAGPSNLRSNASEFTAQNSLTNKTDHYQTHRPGRILTHSANIQYAFPFATTRYDQYVAVLAANLRGIAAMLVMPEFMFTSDASNGNYASTMVAQGPAHRQFERAQYSLIAEDLALLKEAMRHAVDTARIPAEALDMLCIKADAPSAAASDRVAETAQREVLHRNKVLSKKTWTQLEELDYAEEQANNTEHDEAYPPLGPGLSLPGFDDAEDDDDPPKNESGKDDKKTKRPENDDDDD